MRGVAVRASRKPWAILLAVVLALTGVVVAVERFRSERDSRRVVYQPAEVVFADDFERTVSSGWGKAVANEGYVLDGESGHSVFDGTARVDLPKPRIGHSQTLEAVSVEDAVMSVDVTAPAAAKAGNGVYFSLHVRSSDDGYYRAQLRFAPRGQVSMSIARVGGDAEVTELAPERTVASGVAPGDVLRVDVEVAGASPVLLNGGVRRPGEARQWQIVTEDSGAGRLVSRGGVTLRSYLSGSTEGPKIVQLDNLVLQRLVAATVPGKENPAAPPAAPPLVLAPHAATVGLTFPDRGAAELGTTRYPLPTRLALFVSTTGDDRSPATAGAPLRTLAAAVRRAPTGATIVVRQGIYSESVTIPAGKRLTVQSYPGETVWLDGSSTVSGFRRSGSVWIAADWKYRFDASPTYTKGAPDGSEPGWRFVDPRYPMAAHPDQLWVGGARQAQVATREQVVEGTFFVDRDRRELVLGSDPSGRTVRASTLSKALTVAGEGSRIRGIGVRRYATSVWQLGAVTVNAPAVSVQNVVVSDNATTGISINAAGVRLEKVTAVGNGMLGLHAHQADGLVVSDVLAGQNNLESFNRAPVAGGMKITSSRGVSVRRSVFADNLGNGLWIDESAYQVRILSSAAVANTGTGVVLEVSSRALVAGNTITDNQGNGLMVINTDTVEIANNTISGNRQRGLGLTTSDRPRTGRRAAVDSRRPKDPAMVWVARDVTAYNNLIEGGGKCLVCVEDVRTRQSPPMRGLTFNYNVYRRTSAANGPFAAWLERGQPVSYPDFATYRARTRQDAASREFGGSQSAKPLAEDADALRRLASTARAVSEAVAQAVGRSAGERRIGAWWSAAE